MTFLALTPTGRYLCIRADSFFTARAFAASLLGDSVDVQPTGEHAVVDVSLRWSGSDAGTRPDRHLEIRKRGGKWRRV